MLKDNTIELKNVIPFGLSENAAMAQDVNFHIMKQSKTNSYCRYVKRHFVKRDKMHPAAVFLLF